MKILGIFWEENSTAALYVDGKIVACVSEERFSKEKNDERYPKNAIEYVLKAGNIESKDLDYVAFASRMWNPIYILTRRYSKFNIQDRLREQRDYWYPMLYKNQAVRYLDIFRDKIDTDQYPYDWSDVISFIKSTDEHPQKRSLLAEYLRNFRKNVIFKHLGIVQEKIIFTDHHDGHAAYAYYASPRNYDDTVLIMTGDAWGDDINATVNIGLNGDIKRLASSNNFIGAHLYRYITQLLGMKPDEHEYKVMGLAPYGKLPYYKAVKDNSHYTLVTVKGTGPFVHYWEAVMIPIFLLSCIALVGALKKHGSHESDVLPVAEQVEQAVPGAA